MCKILSFVLAVVFVLSMFAACNKTDTDSTDNSNNAESSADATESGAAGVDNTPADPDALLSIDAKYVVVRPAKCDSAIVDAAAELKETIATATGGEITIKEDTLRGDEAPAQYEILVGQTNREESGKALEGLAYGDYIVTATGDKLVINSLSTDSLLDAIEYVKGLFADKSGTVSIKAEDLKTEKVEYKYDDIKLGDTSLEGYTIIIPNNATALVKSYADKFQAAVLENSGILLPIERDVIKETDKEILLGSTSRDASKKIKVSGLATNGYKITKSGSKIVIKGKDDDYVFLKVMSDVVAQIEESGSFAEAEGKVTVNKDPVFTTFCFTDVHNNFAMLEPTNSTGNYIVRKNVSGMIDLLLKDENFGAVDMVMVGGDLVSDYPFWDKTGQGRWPYGYFVEYRQLLVETFAKLAKDGKCVIFTGGNHDYSLGEDAVGALHVADGYTAAAPHTPTGNYNSSDYYFGDVGMRQNVGELPEENMYWKVGEHTGDKYLLGYYYKMNGVHVFGIAPDPDHENVWIAEGTGFDENCLEWFDKKLDEIDPYGTEVIFVNCHYVLDQSYETGGGSMAVQPSEDVRAIFVPIYKGHNNLFHFYGHWEEFYHDYSVRGVLHYNAAGNPIVMKGNETSSLDYLGDVKRSFTSVNMGHFRPAGSRTELFMNDWIKGYGGYDKYQQQDRSTRTPKVGQGVYVKVYDNRIVFQYVNYGTASGYATTDKFQPYTVWLYK